MLKDAKIASKVTVGFIIALLIACVIGLVGRQAMNKNYEVGRDLGSNRLPSVYGLEEMSDGMSLVGGGLQGLCVRRFDAKTRQTQYDAIANGLKKFNDGRRVYEPLPQSPEEARIWQRVTPVLDEWQRRLQSAMDLQREHDALLNRGTKSDDPALQQVDDRALQAVLFARETRLQAMSLMSELVKINYDLALQIVKDTETATAHSSEVIFLVLFLGAAIVVAAAFVIARSVNAAIRAVAREAQTLTESAVAGQLAVRGDVAAVPAEFRAIVQGMNETLDAVTVPLNVAADYVDHISRGEIPPPITDRYNGDFNTIKNNLNRCIGAVNQMVTDAQTLVQAAIDGRLATRADASKHQGDFRRIVEGVNKTLDAVINPLMEATQVLEALARYDLRARVLQDYSGDHARIKTALNGTAKALHDAMAQVADAVDEVSNASAQIASSSQSVAQGASEQASSLEETSASLEEISGMTKQNADNTIQARSLAQSTKEAAEKGGHAMARMIDAMEKIRAASEGTAEIIKDINDIAFQTNLLALNAAVEAARAGDAGRGFAVVAEEVRNLALRSKEAAKKTEDLIKMSVGHAENGRVISGEVAGSLTEIVSAAGKVNDIVSEIAGASQEQSRGIEQVNKAVSEMDKVVQVAAANAEESSSAAEELSGQSDELTSLVSRFQIERDGGRRTAKRDAAPARRHALSVAPRRGPAPTPRKSSGTNGTRKPTAEDLIPFEKEDEMAEF